ncbi:hypothetical protein HK104_006384, partial [Borealophlyctis nickersoniae]
KDGVLEIPSDTDPDVDVEEEEREAPVIATVTTRTKRSQDPESAGGMKQRRGRCVSKAAAEAERKAAARGLRRATAASCRAFEEGERRVTRALDRFQAAFRLPHTPPPRSLSTGRASTASGSDSPPARNSRSRDPESAGEMKRRRRRRRCVSRAEAEAEREATRAFMREEMEHGLRDTSPLPSRASTVSRWDPPSTPPFPTRASTGSGWDRPSTPAPPTFITTPRPVRNEPTQRRHKSGFPSRRRDGGIGVRTRDSDDSDSDWTPASQRRRDTLAAARRQSKTPATARGQSKPNSKPPATRVVGRMMTRSNPVEVIDLLSSSEVEVDGDEGRRAVDSQGDEIEVEEVEEEIVGGGTVLPRRMLGSQPTQTHAVSTLTPTYRLTPDQPIAHPPPAAVDNTSDVNMCPSMPAGFDLNHKLHTMSIPKRER